MRYLKRQLAKLKILFRKTKRQLQSQQKSLMLKSLIKKMNETEAHRLTRFSQLRKLGLGADLAKHESNTSLKNFKAVWEEGFLIFFFSIFFGTLFFFFGNNFYVFCFAVGIVGIFIMEVSTWEE